MILSKTTEKQDVDTFNAVRNTCLRFRSIVEEKRDDILPPVYLDFYENVLQSLPRRENKIKVSVNKLSKHFGPNSGAIDDLRKAIAIGLVAYREKKIQLVCDWTCFLEEKEVEYHPRYRYNN